MSFSLLERPVVADGDADPASDPSEWTMPVVENVTFADFRLQPSTLAALAKMGIVNPTPIQAEAMPALLDGRDVIGQARTGSGKTLAFGIPAVEVVDPSRRQVQVLVLTPTRELAVQVGGVLDAVGAPRGVRSTLIFGGRALGPQRDILKRGGVHVVVGTPGRVLDLLNQGALWLDQVRFLVLDEADEMLDRGFAPDVEKIIARTSNSRQTALFSATVPDWVRQTAAKHLNDPVTVKVDPNPEDIPAIEHVAYDIASGDKLGALRDLLDNRGEGAIIVFGRTKHGIKKLARQLEGFGYPVSALQGNLSQNARDAVMADFRSGRVRILLATNVAARGLDVSDIEQVINVELPESPDLLTHRVGRTGRMGRKGQAITLLGPEDGAKWRQLERGLGRRIPRLPWRGAAAAIAGLSEDAARDAATAPIGRDRAPSMPVRRDGAPSMPTRREAPSSAERGTASTAPAAAMGRIHAGSSMTSVSSGGGDRPMPDLTGGRGVERSRNGRNGRTGVGNGRGERTPAPQASVLEASPAGLPESERGGQFQDLEFHPDDVAVPSSAAPKLVAYTRDPHRPAWAAGGGAEPRATTGEQPVERRRERARHEIVCAACGQTATVPFRPDTSRPVYCGDCFQPKSGGRRGAVGLGA